MRSRVNTKGQHGRRNEDIFDDVQSDNVKINKKNKSTSKGIKIIVIKFAFIILIFYICFFWLFGLTRMKDLSMKPTIQPGSLVLYYRLDKNYVVGDVVTYKKDGKRYVSRIIALPNEEVRLSVDGDFLTSNGNEQHLVYFENYIPEDSNIKYPYRVGPNQVFVMGDYRVEANDSRVFGAIDIDSIDGKVISFMQTKDI